LSRNSDNNRPLSLRIASRQPVKQNPYIADYC
jgi:hypothetical protein